MDTTTLRNFLGELWCLMKGHPQAPTVTALPDGTELHNWCRLCKPMILYRGADGYVTDTVRSPLPPPRTTGGPIRG